MAYLMATKKLKMEEAYEYVKSRRKIVSPNFNFMGQLLNFEQQLFGVRSVISSSPRYNFIDFRHTHHMQPVSDVRHEQFDNVEQLDFWT
ncbi:Dual specificity protein phosphatase 4-like protein, partial [Dinothrombium tinctorium]